MRSQRTVRTFNPDVQSVVLYQLSYLGMLSLFQSCSGSTLLLHLDQDARRLFPARPIYDDPPRATVAIHAATSVEVVRRAVQHLLLISPIELHGHVDVSGLEGDGVNGVVHVGNYTLRAAVCTHRREWEMGFEPTASTLARLRSNRLSYTHGNSIADSICEREDRLLE